MSDIERALAEALRAAGFNDDPVDPIENQAAAILATPSMQAIARDAELGAAVERLTDAIAWTLRGGPDGSHTEAWNTQTGAVGTGSTIPEAIAAALGDDDE